MIYYFTLGYLTNSQKTNSVSNEYLNLFFENIIPQRFEKNIEIGRYNYYLFMTNKTNFTELHFEKKGNSPEIKCYNILKVIYQSSMLFNEYEFQCINMLSFIKELSATSTQLNYSIFLSLFLGTFWIFQIIYLKLMKKKIKFNAYYAIDILIMFCSLLYITNYYLIIDYKTKNNKKWKVFEVNYLIRSNFLSLTLLIFLLWIKFTAFIRMTKSLGIIIKIIELMILDLISFVVILTLDIFAFGSLFYVLFKPYYSDFDSIFHTMRNLVGNHNNKKIKSFI